MICVYMASRYSRRAELQQYAAELRRLGIETTSRWHGGDHDVPDESAMTHAVQMAFALEDIADIEKSDLVIAFTEPPGTGPSRGGRHVEVGYALGLGIPVIVCGWRENVFMHLPAIVYCETWDVAKRYVAGLHLDSSGKVRIAA